MKRKNKILFYILFGIVLLTVIVVCNVMWHNSQIKGVRVVVSYGDSRTEVLDTLVSSGTLEQLILHERPTLRTLMVKQVDKQDVRQVVMTNPYVERADISVSIRSEVVVRVVQRTPIVRMFMHGEEFYLDREGKYMPVSQEGSVSVLVGNGSFSEYFTSDHAVIDYHELSTDEKYCNLPSVRVWRLASYLYQHPDYGCLFDQVSINADGDLLLVPKVGSHIVVVGDLDSLDTRFSDLLDFYRKGMKQVGWNTYKQVSIKYNGQVICTAR